MTEASNSNAPVIWGRVFDPHQPIDADIVSRFRVSGFVEPSTRVLARLGAGQIAGTRGDAKENR